MECSTFRATRKHPFRNQHPAWSPSATKPNNIRPFNRIIRGLRRFILESALNCGCGGQVAQVVLHHVTLLLQPIPDAAHLQEDLLAVVVLQEAVRKPVGQVFWPQRVELRKLELALCGVYLPHPVAEVQRASAELHHLVPQLLQVRVRVVLTLHEIHVADQHWPLLVDVVDPELLQPFAHHLHLPTLFLLELLNAKQSSHSCHATILVHIAHPKLSRASKGALRVHQPVLKTRLPVEKRVEQHAIPGLEYVQVNRGCWEGDH
mmetsp:Transcript_5421/g.15081  ORF Transcript_5421/g.15081 Transcript_5421/m.15081 type:complete len:262 (+) Transcript_5421:173-958(+)